MEGLPQGEEDKWVAIALVESFSRLGVGWLGMGIDLSFPLLFPSLPFRIAGGLASWADELLYLVYIPGKV